MVRRDIGDVPRAGRTCDGIEALFVLALIIAYIWLFRGRGPMIILIVLVVLASHMARRESPATIGLSARRFRAILPALLVIALGLSALVAFGPRTPIPLDSRARQLLGGRLSADVSVGVVATAVFAFYWLWGTVQQYALNGYFTNRFTSALSDKRAGRLLAAIAAALCFGIAHLPNFALAVPSAALGLISALAWQRYRNLFALGLAHGVLGTIVVLTVLSSMPSGLKTGHDAADRNAQVRDAPLR